MSFAKSLCLDDVRYSAWANDRMLERCSTLAADEVKRDLGNSHVCILDTLAHIYDGERVWLDCLRTSPESGPWRLPQGPSSSYSLDELRRCWPEIWSGYFQVLEETSETDLGVEIVAQLSGEVKPSLPRWKILKHVLDHSTFHRGQLVGMIRALGHLPPAINRMDYYLPG
jgi:uncharacterized damage-inducible protein DinB